MRTTLYLLRHGATATNLSRARRVSLANCGISVVTRTDGETVVETLNSTFHLGPASIPDHP